MIKYDDIIKDQIQKGVVEEVTSDNPETVKHYIPHFPVITPQKTTTKVRIVYDASAKTRKDAKSLNDCIYRGPIFMENLCGLLMRFRLTKLILLSDIEKAFLQVGLQPQERDVTRFLWIKDLKATPTAINTIVMRFARVPFGMVSSPFLLGATVDHYLKSYNTKIANDIRSNIYMDNVILGAKDLEQANLIYKYSKDIFYQAGMNLREWTSNSSQFMQSLPKKDKGSSGKMKVLGLQYNTDTDKISNFSNFKEIGPVSTKREVLKLFAQVFDPLGLFAPFTLGARIFLQTLWIKGLDWDDSIPNEDCERWLKIIASINQIANIQLPRQLFTFEAASNINYELLCFCDASLEAYCAAIYLKATYKGTSEISLVFTKSRVAPIKTTLSIPRLELMAALIGVRALNFVQKELRLDIKKRILWSDSQCVLHWIKSEKSTQVFVTNRIKEIKQSHDIQFRYINTSDNPADLATRSNCCISVPKEWWFGPEWLKSPINLWPDWEQNHCPKEESTAVLITSEIKEDKTMNIPFSIDIAKYSSFTRLIRVTAWCQRFIDNMRKQNNNDTFLHCEEINKAKNTWIKSAQNAKYDGNQIGGLKHLKLFKDSDGILRSPTRLNNANWSEQTKNPIILPKDHEVTWLIIQDYHRKLAHAGTSHTLSQLRYQYMIPQGRNTVNKCIKKCSICKTWEGGPYKTPEYPQLPESRVQSSPPFTYVGLDYFGPLYTKDIGKVGVCLFTCLTCRAVHLEIIKDMSTEEFMMAFRRFVARRGKPKHMLSDNASQFKLAKSAIEKQWNKVLRSTECQEYAATEDIKWSFTLPMAPWQGGCYERLIGVTKRALRKSLGRLCLSSIQLITLIQEVEAIVNSRPITFVKEDDEEITLSPAHFLSLNPKLGLINFSVENDILKDKDYQEGFSNKENVITSWKRGQAHLKAFWKTWHEDYLFNLRERQGWKMKEKRILSKEFPNVGSVVLVKEKNITRPVRKLGRISHLIQSKDGSVRGAKVKVGVKMIDKPLSYLYPLEVFQANNDIASELPSLKLLDSANDYEPVMSPPTRKRKSAVKATSRIKDILKKESDDIDSESDE